MEANKTRELTTSEVYQVMHLFESEPFEDVNDGEDFEDITDELFDVVDNHLEDCGILYAPSIFKWDQTMTSFEAMHEKMDIRLQRNNVVNKYKEILEEFDGMKGDELSQGRKLALMRELLL